MNKAPAFLFYAGDFLSSPDVQAMDTREVGAYCLLLLNAWQGDLPGHLPNNEDRLRRICRMTVAEWEVSGELLLSKFPVADMGHTRYNPRLVAEAQKQAENRAKKSENGKRGGRPSKSKTEANGNQQLSIEKQMLSKTKANDKLTESLSISITSTTDVVPPMAATAANPAATMARATTEVADEQRWDESPLTKPHGFEAICKANGYLEIDFEYYRLQALDAAEHETPQKNRTAPQWRSWVRIFLDRTKQRGPLQKPAIILPNQIPSNAPANYALAPAASMGIPDPASYLKPEYLPQG